MQKAECLHFMITVLLGLSRQAKHKRASGRPAPLSMPQLLTLEFATEFDFELIDDFIMVVPCNFCCSLFIWICCWAYSSSSSPMISPSNNEVSSYSFLVEAVSLSSSSRFCSISSGFDLILPISAAWVAYFSFVIIPSSNNSGLPCEGKVSEVYVFV